ncbi:MAG: hypothetical protein JNK38_13490 [Acidobacteria bacterium]|nr:hypothetical protein [Acidobacteriota bacterium]
MGDDFFWAKTLVTREPYDPLRRFSPHVPAIFSWIRRHAICASAKRAIAYRLKGFITEVRLNSSRRQNRSGVQIKPLRTDSSERYLKVNSSHFYYIEGLSPLNIMEFKKVIHPVFVMSYPAMSVYEFQHFKEESEVLEYWQFSSIYLICQRPTLYFENVFCNEGVIKLHIKQQGRDDLLDVELEFYKGGKNEKYIRGNGEFCVDVCFFDKESEHNQPLNHVAGVRFLDGEGQFIFWLTPERLLFEYFNHKLSAKIVGDIGDFIKYSVHYIGQAQDQAISQRLKAHEKLVAILSTEHPLIEGASLNRELILIFLRFARADEHFMLLPGQAGGIESMENIQGKNINDRCRPRSFDELKEFAVNDFEAYLINLFEPKHNKILFKNYPNIANGLKYLGYDQVEPKLEVVGTLITECGSYLLEISEIEPLVYSTK